MSKKLSKRLPSYRKHKGSGQAVSTFCGKAFYHGTYGTKESYERYEEFIAKLIEWKSQFTGSDQPPPLPKLRELEVSLRPKRDIAVVEAADRYLSYCETHKTPGEQAHVRSMLKCVVNRYENERAAAIGPAELREIRR